MSRELTLLLFVCVSTTATAQESSSPSAGTATLPLSELLRLQAAGAANDGRGPETPPIAATLRRFEITGRLLENGLDATADLEISVVSAEWHAIPLLTVRPTTHLMALPTLDAGVLAVVGESLCLVTNRPGDVRLTLRWLETALAPGGERRLEVGLPSPAPAVLRLQYDRALIRLTGAEVHDDGSGVVVYPTAGRLSLRWRQLAPIAARRPLAPRPPVEPVVTAAHASIVATLDGRRLSRIQYHLRFEGAQTFVVTVPVGQTVERVFLHGAARPFAQNGRELVLAVAPARAGDETATVELVTREETSGYPLSGTLSFTLPQPQWGLNDLFVALHLPAVFNYTWAGGSLESANEVRAVEFAYAIPTPGKSLLLHQQLVSLPADVQVTYTVDLAANIFR